MECEQAAKLREWKIGVVRSFRAASPQFWANRASPFTSASESQLHTAPVGPPPSMSCQPTVSTLNCTAKAVNAMKIHHIVFGSLTLVVAAFFITTIVRRWWHLRERLNTFWVISVSILMWLPAWIIYFSVYLAGIGDSKPAPAPLLSVMNWMGLIPLGNTFAPLIAAWLQLSAKKRLSSRRMKADWPVPLIIAQTIFEIVAIASCILAGWPKIYPYAERTILCTCTLYLWCCGASLWYGARRIKSKIRTLAKPKQAVAFDPSSSEEAREDAVSRVTRSLDRVLVLLVCCIFIPASIVLVLHASFLEYIDKNIWATQVFWGSYRTFALAYILYWAFSFWNETDYRVSSSGRTDRTTTTTSADRTASTPH